jgi:hypothetical protein
MWVSASSTSSWVTGSASAPPSDSGTFSAKSPDSASARTVAGGKVRSRSPSSAPAATTSRRPSTVARRCARLAARSVGNAALFGGPA